MEWKGEPGIVEACGGIAMFRAEARAAEMINHNPGRYAHYLTQEAEGLLESHELQTWRLLYGPPMPYTRARFEATYEWMHRDWRRGPQTIRAAPAFDGDRWGVEGPDCDLVAGYKERLLNPAATTHLSHAP
jgi:hypothetical protein